MAKHFSDSFYHSKRWYEARHAYIEQRVAIDGGLCEVCHKRMGVILHHKIILTPELMNDVDVLLNPDNLRWECKDCHDHEEGHWIGKDKASIEYAREPLKYDDKGNIIVPNE